MSILSPLAYLREAERCEVCARLAEADYERVQAKRWRRLAGWARGMAGRLIST